ncbi:MAG: hypothetical protein WB678_07575 [Stellaceae bacterium]
MNPTLLKAALLAVPAGTLLYRAVGLCRSEKSAANALQLFGASFLMIVVLAHVCEALGLLSLMRWGDGDSPGHYLDLASAVLGLTSFSIGYFVFLSTTRRRRRARR